MVEKLLDLQKDQSKINNTYFDKNIIVKNKNVEYPQFKVTRKTLLNTNKKKVIVVGNSITKFLCSDELSTSERSVSVMNTLDAQWRI